jgi:PAS domain-containing protein
MEFFMKNHGAEAGPTSLSLSGTIRPAPWKGLDETDRRGDLIIDYGGSRLFRRLAPWFMARPPRNRESLIDREGRHDKAMEAVRVGLLEVDRAARITFANAI